MTHGRASRLLGRAHEDSVLGIDAAPGGRHPLRVRTARAIRVRDPVGAAKSGRYQGKQLWRPGTLGAAWARAGQRPRSSLFAAMMPCGVPPPGKPLEPGTSGIRSEGRMLATALLAGWYRLTSVTGPLRPGPHLPATAGRHGTRVGRSESPASTDGHCRRAGPSDGRPQTSTGSAHANDMPHSPDRLIPRSLH